MMSLFGVPSTPASASSQTATAKLGMTHVVRGINDSKISSSALRAHATNRFSQKKSETGDSRHGRVVPISKTLGNDQSIPWTRPIKDLTEVQIVGYIPPHIAMTTSTVATVYGAWYGTVSLLDNFTALSGVFDQYKITCFEALFVPVITEATSPTLSSGLLATTVDIDDANVPTTFEQVGSHERSLETNGTMMHYHRWSPTYAIAAYSGAFTSYSQGQGWVDCGSPTVQHYGLKYANTAVGTAAVVNLLVRMTVLLRGLH